MAHKRIFYLVQLTALTISGCAQDTVPTAPMSQEELRRHCLAEMYSDRASRGRSAPNWSLYDYCMNNAKVRDAPAN